jgi:hypothetical protein
VHCWCCTGSGGAAASNREPLAAVAAAAGLGSAGGKATDAVQVLVDSGAAAMGSGLAPGSVTAPTGVESRGGVDVGGLRQAGDGAPEDDLAVASLAPSGGDAKRTQSARLQAQTKDKSNDNAAVTGSAGSAMKLNMAVGVRGAVVGWPPRVCRATMCCNRW